MGSLTNRREKSVCLRLEILEDRLAPSVSVLPVDSDGNGSLDTLRITGDDARQVVRISTKPDKGLTMVDLDANGDGDFTDPGEMSRRFFIGNFSTIDVQLYGGNDKVVFTPTGIYKNFNQTIMVDTGGGNDKVSFADWPDPFNGRGNHPVLDHSVLQYILRAGDGDDSITLDDLPYIQNGSFLLADMQLGTGNNFLRFNSDTEISGGSTLTYAITGSDQAGDVDVVTANIVADVLDTSKVSYDVKLLKGNDQFTGTIENNFNLRGPSSFASVSVDAGDGNDTVVLNDNDLTNGTGLTLEGLLKIELLGGLGNDKITADFTSGDGLRLAGNLQLKADGGAGADALDVRLKNTATSAGNYDVALLGGLDNDTLKLAVNTLGARFLKYKHTDPLPDGILLDGGDGVDTKDITGVSPGVPVNVVNCEL